MELTGGKLLVEALKANGVRHLFGIPGVHDLSVYDALIGEETIVPIVNRHEQGASYAADAYGKLSGRPGVFIVVPGPGATNAASGVAVAYQESSPMVAITTEVSEAIRGRSATHDTDVEALYKPIVKAQVRARGPEDIPQAVNEACRLATSGRPGPVQLLIAGETLAGRAPAPAAFQAAKREKPRPGPRVLRQIDEAAVLLREAQNPIIYAGCGVQHAGAREELIKLAERLSAPVMTSVSGRGIFPEDHPLSLGLFHFKGVPEVLARADACLAVGTVFSEISTIVWLYPMPQNLIQIDIDPKEIGKNYPVRLGIVADAKPVLQRLLERLPNRRPPSEIAGMVSHFHQQHARELAEFMAQPPTRPVHPLWFIRTLRQATPPETVFISDGAATEMWLFDQAVPMTLPRSLIIPEIYQTMGYAVPAAIGARLACPERPAVVVTGDGSFTMMVGELATAVAYGLTFLVFIFNDGYYNALRLFQRYALGERYTCVKLNDPDFVQLAQAFGAKGRRLEDPAQLPALVQEGLAGPGVTVVDVPIDPDVVSARFLARTKAGLVTGAKKEAEKAA